MKTINFSKTNRPKKTRVILHLSPMGPRYEVVMDKEVLSAKDITDIGWLLSHSENLELTVRDAMLGATAKTMTLILWGEVLKKCWLEISQIDG